MLILLFVICWILLPFLPRIRLSPLKNLTILVCSISFSGALLELMLRCGFLYSNLVWTPEKWVQYKRTMDRAIFEQSLINPLGFNDTTVSPIKIEGTTRLAVVGDSFVWGEGLKDADRWTKKLEVILKATNPNFRVLHWGKRGWSTLDEFIFLKDHLAEWSIDYVIIGFVINDLDMKAEEAMEVNIGYGGPGDLLAPLHDVFPNVSNLIGAMIRNVVYNHRKELGVGNVEARTWLPHNLENYGAMLRNLKLLLDRNGIQSFVVLCPNSPDHAFLEKFEIIRPYFDRAGFNVLDLYPAVSAELSDYSPIDLMAHRGDGHPGPLVTSIYAREVAKHIKVLGWLNFPH